MSEQVHSPTLSAAELRPTIIAREQHCISRRNISPNALRVLYRLRDGGYAAHLVGGAVRDLLLGGHPKDYDVATDATPEQVRQLFRNCRLIGRRFRLAHVVFGPEIIEVATFRGNVDDGSGDRHVVDGRIVRDNIWGTIAEDAIRRDFTVNALYYDIADFSVRDYVGGYADLLRRELKLIGDPEQRYREDPVRMLRAVRLAAKLDFGLDREAATQIFELGYLLAESAPARLFDEVLKLFLSGHASESFRLLEHYELMGQIFPLTAAALAADSTGATRKLLDSGLASTDARILAGKTVTPAFLFAALLWGPVQHEEQRLRASGIDASLSWQRAAAHVLNDQVAHIAIPRRFSVVMTEIWALQPRFEQKARKRVHRLLAHPRFRAAYDFLLLRQAESPQVAELGQWWTEAQTLAPHDLTERLVAEGAPGTRSKPRGRRRRRRGPESGAAETAPVDNNG